MNRISKKWVLAALLGATLGSGLACRSQNERAYREPPEVAPAGVQQGTTDSTSGTGGSGSDSAPIGGSGAAGQEGTLEKDKQPKMDGGTGGSGMDTSGGALDSTNRQGTLGGSDSVDPSMGGSGSSTDSMNQPGETTGGSGQSDESTTFAP